MFADGKADDKLQGLSGRYIAVVRNEISFEIRMGEWRLAIKSKSQGEKNRALKSVRYGYFWTNSCGDQTFFPEVTLPKPNHFFIEESVAFDVMESFRSDPEKIYGGNNQNLPSAKSLFSEETGSPEARKNTMEKTRSASLYFVKDFR